MIEIKNLNELHGMKFENLKIEVLESEDGNGIIEIENHKESMITTIKYSGKKRIKTIRTLERLLGTKIRLTNLNSEEILSYIEGKDFSKSLWSPVGKAMHDFNMIEDGDKIAVGFSGGKDSTTLLNALVRVQKISKIRFEIIPIHIHPVEDLARTQGIEEYCNSLGLKLHIIETKLKEILFSGEGISNPCFICGRIRRGILYTTLKEMGIKKLMLGHHKDDIIETFLMNSFYQGNLHMMKPSYTSKDHGIRVMRPLAYVEESTIIRYSKSLSLPILKSECPYETSTDSKRLRIKNLVKELSNEDANFRSVIFNSIKALIKE